MNRELRRVSWGIFALFLSLFVSSTVIQVFQVDNLRVDERNSRTLLDSYSTERGAIVASNTIIAESIPVDDQFRYQRTYYDGPMYSAVTGYFTISQGISGIESAMNDELSGQSNQQFFDQVLALVSGRDPRGATVQLTLDPEIQKAAWNALGDNAGSVVALDPTTGRILAMVSKPAYDPNELAAHDTETVIGRYQQLLVDESAPLVNRAISGGLYHPGSVFKLIVTAAALDSGLIRDTTTVPNPASLKLPGSTSVIKNSGGGRCGSGDTVTLETALRLSCNIPFAEIGTRIGSTVINSYAEEFGFGASLEIPMAVTPSTYPANMDAAQIMLSSFGQYDVRVSPLQMAMVSAAIANGGVLMAPTVVDSVLAPDLSILKSFQAQEYSQPISKQTASLMTTMMIGNVSNGVASNARISGVKVAGKTGTAENGEGEPYTLWFTGFAPADNPRVAVAVVIENGGGFGQSANGNRVAAPIARTVIEAVLAQ
ncbi:cell elongation-specific peptidoglycan D,D-transpeptidase [Microbacteriaceae bacterium MWH-Ta3]|nr:cell elongation-specific peptidoglycan D,D-transpeptidase [Microbacteriaceae bacterium MWH-Ta3]